MASSLQSVITQFVAMGMPPIQAHELRVDLGKFLRYGPGKKAYYKVFSHTTKLGNVVYVGTFGYKGDGPWKIEADGDQALSAEELQELRDKQAAIAARELAKREENGKRAAGRAHYQWGQASKTGQSDYLTRKGVARAESVRYDAEGAVLVPLINYMGGQLVGLQKIYPDGSKRFNSGMIKDGAGCRLGDEPADGGPLWIAEGYATATTLREALAYAEPVYMALDAGNLGLLARVLRKRFPRSPICFAADDDYLTGEVGRIKAEIAAADVGNARVVLPVFSSQRAASKDDPSAPMWTDFNDLHLAEGLGAVRTCLNGAASPAPASEVLPSADSAESGGGVVPWSGDLVRQRFALIFGGTNVWDDVEKVELKKPAFTALVGGELAKLFFADPAKRIKDPKSLPKVRKAKDAEAGERSQQLLDRYTLLYGTETVWDSDNRLVLSLSALRAAWGGDTVKFWQESPLRKMVDAENLVFDPTERVSPETHINLFGGMPMQPVADADLCDSIIELSMRLCGFDPKVWHWMMQWIALPLQKPGTKMHTSILMFGEKQGSGKSLFWEGVIKTIYGEYGTTIGQHQLESQFTAWQSRRLFVLAEEVVGRAEKYSHIGTIKHLVTGRTVRINEKNMPEREEANHANMVFLSNEVQPLHLELEDRRFLVIEPRDGLPEENQRRIKADLESGAVAAFYHCLLNYKIDADFDERSKPPMTDAKGRIIEFGLSGWQLFHRQWRDGDLFVPYCTCSTVDLFKAFKRWASDGDERATSMTKFLTLLSSREKKSVEKIYDGSSRKNVMVFLIGEPDPTMPKVAWISKEVNDFRMALNSD